MSRRLRDGLAEADELLERRRFGPARALLDDLLKDHPENVAVLRTLAKTAAGIDDVHTYQFACERLFHLCPRDPDLPYMLADAYLKSVWPALALDMARRALARSPGSGRQRTARIFCHWRFCFLLSTFLRELIAIDLYANQRFHCSARGRRLERHFLREKGLQDRAN